MLKFAAKIPAECRLVVDGAFRVTIYISKIWSAFANLYVLVTFFGSVFLSRSCKFWVLLYFFLIQPLRGNEVCYRQRILPRRIRLVGTKFC